MKEITDILDGTPLANKTFSIYSTDKGEKTFGYTPWSITTWNQGEYDHYDPRNVSYVFHEIAHIITVAEQGLHKDSRLYKNNFGYPEKNDLTEHSHAYKECKVLAIQAVLEKDNPTIVQPYDPDKVFKILKEHHRMPFDRKHFDFMLENYTHHVYPGRLYDTWRKACWYVKEFRTKE